MTEEELIAIADGAIEVLDKANPTQKERIKIIAEFLGGAIIWEDTPQGLSFWADFVDRLSLDN